MSGHGHVTPNADGTKTRCGGPTICPECALEYARANVTSIEGVEKLDAARMEAEYEPVGLMSLEKLIHELDENHSLGDAVYDVRCRVVDDEEYGRWDGDSWDHPVVRRYGDLVAEVMVRLKKVGLR